jgi:glycine cleavage system H lipoate-binding protein
VSWSRPSPSPTSTRRSPARSSPEALDATPELVNNDPYGGGWLFEVKPAGEVGDGLMDAATYEASLEG